MLYQVHGYESIDISRNIMLAHTDDHRPIFTHFIAYTDPQYTLTHVKGVSGEFRSKNLIGSLGNYLGFLTTNIQPSPM